MNVMPVLKGLVGNMPEAAQPRGAAGAPGTTAPLPLTLDDLTADELESLQQAAEQAAADGLLDSIPMTSEAGETQLPEGAAGAGEAAETAADEAAESPEQQAAEQAAGTEMHSTTEFIAQATAGADECESMLDELKDAIDELDDASEADSILESAEEAFDAVKDIVKEAEAAADSDDINAAAGAAAQVDEIKKTIADSISQVAKIAEAAAASDSAGGSSAGGSSASGSSAGGSSSGGSSSGGASVNAPVGMKGGLPPLVMWAQRATGAKGCGR